MTLDNYPLLYESLPQDDRGNEVLTDDQCVFGGEHELLIESDDIPEFLNGHLSERHIEWGYCGKCGVPMELPEKYEPDRLEDL